MRMDDDWRQLALLRDGQKASYRREKRYLHRQGHASWVTSAARWRATTRAGHFSSLPRCRTSPSASAPRRRCARARRAFAASRAVVRLVLGAGRAVPLHSFLGRRQGALAGLTATVGKRAGTAGRPPAQIRLGTAPRDARRTGPFRDFEYVPRHDRPVRAT